MKRLFLAAAILATACLFGLRIGAGEPAKEDVEKALKAIFQANLEGMNEKDVDKVMSTIHSKSPLVAQTRAGTQNLFRNYDLATKVVKSSYLGCDDEYAVLRVTQETKSKTPNPRFQDNRLDAMHVFCKDGKTWKLWTTALLSVEPLKPAGLPTPPPATPAAPAEVPDLSPLPVQ